MKKVALSACLLGCTCRYDGDDNLNENLLQLLANDEIIPFCPEEHCFGTPRPTMDLIENFNIISAVSNESYEDISEPIRTYAKIFFKNNPDIALFIGKDRSPSCAVRSGKVYDVEKKLLHKKGTGLMSELALELGIESYDAEVYEGMHTLK